MDLNKAMIIGNVTRDPEVRTTPNGQNVVSFGVATNLTWTDQSGEKQQKTEFHNVVAWRKLADIIAQYVQKGKKIYIEGRIETQTWEKDGQKRNRTEIIADNMIMLSGGPGSGGAAPVGNAPKTEAAPAATGTDTKKDTGKDTKPQSEANGEEEINIEDIPF